MPASRSEKTKQASTDFVAGQGGAEAAASEAAASDAMLECMAAVRQEAERLVNVGLDKKKGNLFEYIEAARFNTAAAKQGSSLRSVVTAADGRPHAAADIVVKNGGRVVREVQAKASESAAENAYLVSDSRYEGMQRLIPSDKVERAGQLMDARIKTGTLKAPNYQEARPHLTGELKHADVASGGTSHAELLQAGSHPGWYTLRQEAMQVAGEAAVAGAVAAGTGAVLAGAISLVTNCSAYTRGEINAEELAKRTGYAVAKGTARGAGTGAGGVLIRVGAAKAGLAPLAKSNVATAVAAAGIDVGVTVYDFASGKLSGQEAMERIGQTSYSTASSLYVGAAAGAVFGPPGMLIGSIAGYMLANHTYQGCIAVFRNTKLAEEEAARIVALCDEAVLQMEAQRLIFEAQLEKTTRERRDAFAHTFEQIDAALDAEDPHAAALALSDLAATFGWKLKFATFEEFDTFMMESDEPLRL